MNQKCVLALIFANVFKIANFTKLKDSIIIIPVIWYVLIISSSCEEITAGAWDIDK